MSLLEQEIASQLPNVGFTRRGFVVTALGSGFAAAVMPVGAQTITTDTAGLDAGEVRIPVADGQMPAYRAKPAGRRDLPTVVVIQEVFGVHEHIKDLCRRLAKVGYLAIAPELYARQGDPSKFDSIPELITNIVSKVPDAQVASDLDATVAWAAKNDGDARRSPSPASAGAAARSGCSPSTATASRPASRGTDRSPGGRPNCSRAPRSTASRS